MTLAPTVSVIINTDGRLDSLKDTLKSLEYLDYPSFEVCVIYGPTPDGTKEYVEGLKPDIKIEHCPTRNLAASRNIGIATAAGDIVAFLDDDAIAEPQWLADLINPFDNPDVGAAGGFVYDRSGIELAWRYGTVNRLGHADLTWQRPATELNFPLSYNFPHVLSTNCAFRTSAVLAAGGFDENYEYFLDETDLICRLVDQGW